MGIAFQPGRLAEQALGKYLFDSRFTLGEGGNARGISDAIDFYLDGIRVIINPEHPERAEREWSVKPDATPFEKLKAAFASVRGQNAPAVTGAQKGNLVEHYRTLRNEQLKESRLFLWETVGGRDYIAKNQVTKLSGNEVAKQFNQWLVAHSDTLDLEHLCLSGTSSSFTLTHLPPEIGRFTKLKVLKINKTALESISPQIGRLTQLTLLDLSNNNLKDLPSEIGDLWRLQTFNLVSNKLTKLPSETKRLSGLIVLLLKNNALNEIPRVIGKLPLIQIVSFSDKFITSLPGEIIGMGMMQDGSLWTPHIEKLRDLDLIDQVEYEKGS